MFLDSQSDQYGSGTLVAEARVRTFLAEAARVFVHKPFTPHPLFINGHAQTLIGYAWPRRFRLRAKEDKDRLFEVAPGVRVLAHCRWQQDPRKYPTVVMWHGIEGSSDSVYMLATAQKAFRAGYNVVRVNLRNCGGTEHLTPTLYHGGMSEDLRAIAMELIEKDRLSELFLIGFSLGGNLVLKLAGEFGSQPPPQLLGACAVSPSVDLAASASTITLRSNWIYHQDFVRRLRKRIYLKQKLYPELYDTSEVHLVRTIRDFDDRYTAVAHGFKGADDYYQKASAIRVIDGVQIPTLIIHAQDDPFIPFEPLRSKALTDNPYILLLAPEHGGHVAFVGTQKDGEDRFWAENRVVEFVQMIHADFDH